MRWTYACPLLLGLLLMAVGGTVQAQAPSTRAVPLHRSQISVWGAHSVGTGSILGRIPDGRLRILGLRYHRLLLPTPDQQRASYEAPTLTYTADLIPITTLYIPEEAAPGAYFESGLSTGTSLTTTGTGIYPVGLRVQFRQSQPVQPFLSGHTGLLYFFSPVPDDRGRNLTFAAALGGGVSVSLSRRLSLTLGYRYHHLSNGFRGSINPGFDANLLYLGLGTGI